MKVGKEWLNISDLMAGLMMIFLFIGVALMIEVQKKEQTIQDVKINLNEDLNKEFKKFFIQWSIAKIENETITFNDEIYNNDYNVTSPSINFDTGKDIVKDEFKKILSEFYPKYIEIILSDKYRQYIKEIKIEGHTDSDYPKSMTLNEGYIFNIFLSQKRSKNVLKFLTTLEIFKQNQNFLMSVTRANGVGSANTIQENKEEDKKASRRVDFKVIIDY